MLTISAVVVVVAAVAIWVLMASGQSKAFPDRVGSATHCEDGNASLSVRRVSLSSVKDRVPYYSGLLVRPEEAWLSACSGLGPTTVVLKFRTREQAALASRQSKPPICVKGSWVFGPLVEKGVLRRACREVAGRLISAGDPQGA